MENRNTFHQMIYKEVTHIENLPEWAIHENDFDSHKELLYLAAFKMDGLTVEAGCGYGSTVMLDRLNTDLHSFISIETNIEWKDKIKPLLATSIIGLIKDWNDLKPKPCDVFFCDCAPAEHRKMLIEKMRNDAVVIVVHDTEEGAEYVYGMKEILSTFKYRLDYKPENLPHTTAVSNFIDVTQWVN